METKLFFSNVLQACIDHSTEDVVEHLHQFQEERKRIIEEQQFEYEYEYEDEDEDEDEYEYENEDEYEYEDEYEDEDEYDSDDNGDIVIISLDVTTLVEDKRINCKFPTRNPKNDNKRNNKIMFGDHLKFKRYRYLPSTFQSAILYHIEWQRKLVGHRIGLVIMATAMGKTILAIFDIEKELNDIHNTLGIQYGVECQYKEIEKDKEEMKWTQFKCPCMVHNYIENDLNIRIPQRVNRMTYPTYLFNTNNNNNNNNNNEQEIEATEITPFCLVFIVHTKAIRNSAYIKFKNHFQSIYRNLPNNAFVKIEPSTTFEEIESAKFIFILFQSFDRLKQQNCKILSKVSHVIIDEVHHLLAETWIDVHKTIISPDICPSLQYYLGMTATLSHRTDISGDSLKSLFNNIVYINFPWTIAKRLNFFPNVEYLEALPTLAHGRDNKTYDQYLTEFAYALDANMNDERAEQLYPKTLNRFINNLEDSLKQLKITNDKDIKMILTPEYIVKIVLQYQSMRIICNLPKKKRILIFAMNANDASKIAKLCNINGLKAGAIHYKISPNECENVLNKFKNGKLNVLVNVNVVNEGYDLPSVDCIVMARITSSEIIFVQQLGRGLRKDPLDPNKEICILDLALNLRRRWKVLQDIITDTQIIEYIINFWSVSNFVGTAITMSPAK